MPSKLNIVALSRAVIVCVATTPVRPVTPEIVTLSPVVKPWAVAVVTTAGLALVTSVTSTSPTVVGTVVFPTMTSTPIGPAADVAPIRSPLPDLNTPVSTTTCTVATGAGHGLSAAGAPGQIPQVVGHNTPSGSAQYSPSAIRVQVRPVLRKTSSSGKSTGVGGASTVFTTTPRATDATVAPLKTTWPCSAAVASTPSKTIPAPVTSISCSPLSRAPHVPPATPATTTVSPFEKPWPVAVRTTGEATLAADTATVADCWETIAPIVRVSTTGTPVSETLLASAIVLSSTTRTTWSLLMALVTFAGPVIPEIITELPVLNPWFAEVTVG
mmetsp:Transcript_43305/g.114117  ORF Transcript_43305/g.114117 Transcript_43305/m.114117 type:complete len:328 (+) Transcript_43305:5652-6635(+)